MSSSSYRNQDELFAAAIALAPDDRRRYLDEVCSADTALRSELEVLIHSHDEAGDFLESSPISPTTIAPLLPGEDDAPLPLAIANFKIVGLLGSGGMGRVYLAESANLKRHVALKVIKPGMASRSTLRRFEQEAQVVALLQHPGIAQIYEAGTADTGAGPQPYFAMEYVKGQALNEYTKSHAQDVRSKLELYCKICDAVSHAHAKNVIHRDLKPANILVDETGQPKILDFGVARLADPGTSAMTLHTHAGQLIGTLAYMSPEQVTGDPSGIDARSDVYTLGVILYETLTGKLPHDVNLRSIPEAIRIIKEDSPTSLSTIHREYRGDIETIVNKALEKDKERRYQTAAEVADDIRRSLRDEPIVARPPSTWYQCAKFAKRNKGVVGGTAAAFVALSFGLVFAVTQAVIAGTAKTDALMQADIANAANLETQKQREAAEASAAQANKSREEAVKQKTIAEQNLEIANAVRRLFDEIISSATPDERMGRDVTVLQALEKSDEKLDQIMPEQPEVRVAMHVAIGGMYRKLTEYRKAEPHLRTAVQIARDVNGPDHDDTIGATIQLSLLLGELGKADEALSLCEDIWERARKLYPPDADRRVSVASALAGLYVERERFDEAIPLRQYVIEQRERTLDADAPFLLNARYMLARLLAKKGKYNESIPIERDIVDIHRKSGEPASAMSVTWLVGLGIDLIDTDNFDEAGPIIDEAMRDAEEIYAEDHAGRLSVLNLKGNYLLNRNDIPAAEQVFRKLCEIYRGLDIPPQDGLCPALSNLGSTLQSQKKHAEAELVYKEALDIYDASGEPLTRSRLVLMNNLATSMRLQRKYPDALAIYKRLVQEDVKVLPADHWMRGAHKYGYGMMLLAAKEFVEAEQQLLGADEFAQNSQLPENHELRINIRRVLVDLYTNWDKPAKAEEWRAKLPPELR